MNKKRLAILCLYSILSYSTYGQIQPLSIKADSTLYHLMKGSSLQVILFVANESSEKIEIKGLENLRMDSMLWVYPYAETFFSKNNKDFKDYGCKIDFDPIAWQYRKFSGNRFKLKALVSSSCLEFTGYYKVRLHLFYQVVNSGENNSATSDWFVVKVSQ